MLTMAKSSRKRQQTRTIHSIAVGCCLAAAVVATALVWYKPSLEPVDPTSKQAKLVHVRGDQMLTAVRGLAADLVHPSPFGMEEIARNLSAVIGKRLPVSKE